VSCSSVSMWRRAYRGHGSSNPLVSCQGRRSVGQRLLSSAAPASSVLRDSYGLWINGEEVEAASGERIVVENPLDGSTLTHVAGGGEADVERAVAVATEAFEDGRWSKMQPNARARVLNKAAATLRSRITDMAMIETLSTGRPLREYNAQLARVPEWFEYHGALAQTAEGSLPPFGDSDHLCYVRRVPLGVCGLVTPWNHPLLIAVKKISVCIAAGNTCVVKPPELAPVAVLELARILEDAGCPPGVVNVVPGYGHTAGAALCAHPGIAKVDFTGGTETGRRIGAAVGANVRHYCAELGGNCPVLVFDDAEIDAAVNGAAFGAFVAAGQTCVSAKRLLIHEDLYDEFVAKLVAKVDGFVLGDPRELTTAVGPLVSAGQRDTVEAQVQRGLSEGATALVGGGRPTAERCGGFEDGYFFEPTVLAGATPEMSCFQDEIFGPVVTVTPFRDEAHALELANDTAFGLGAAIWSRDVARAHRVAAGLEAGVIWVNAHHRNAPSSPWGGMGDSGIGRENGTDAYHEYTTTSSTTIRMVDTPEDWFGQLDARYS
jgi:phenylacetaldehyde dehydrogenase